MRPAEQTDDVQGVADATNNLGMVHWRRDEQQLAEAAYTTSRSAAVRLGDMYLAACATANLGQLALEQGRPRETIRLLDAALATFEDRKRVAHQATALWLLAQAHDVLGNRAEALRMATSARDLRPDLGHADVDELDAFIAEHG